MQNPSTTAAVKLVAFLGAGVGGFAGVRLDLGNSIFSLKRISDAQSEPPIPTPTAEASGCVMDVKFCF